MYALSSMVYQYEPEAFRRRMHHVKRHAVYFDGDRVVGFAALHSDRFTHDPRDFVAVGLGMTVIDPGWRNRGLVQRTVVRLIAEAKLRRPRLPVYVWTCASTFRPYLVFSRNLDDMLPRLGEDPTDERLAIARRIGHRYLGDAFDPATLSRGAVRWAMQESVHDGQRTAEDIEFFYDRMRSSPAGTTGLLVVAPASAANFRSWLTRFARSTIRSVHGRRLGAMGQLSALDSHRSRKNSTAG